MAKIYETLKKKNDLSVEVYPNIETPNIPDGAVITDKINNGAITSDKLAIGSVGNSQLADGSITSGKISSNSVTSGKLASNSVTTTKIQDNAVITSKINNGAVTYDKVSDDIYNILQKIEHTYNVTFIDDDNSPTTTIYLGTTTFPLSMDTYSTSDYDSAFDFTKGGISDWNSTDISILKMFIEGFSGNGYNETGSLGSVYLTRYFNGNEYFRIHTSGTNYIMVYVRNNVEIFKMVIDTLTDTITNYIQSDISIVLNKLTKPNITYR